MKRTALTAVLAVVSTGLLAPGAFAVPATPSTAPVEGPTTLLQGRLLLVADAHRGEAPGSASEPDHDDAVQAFLDVEEGVVPVDPSAVAGLTGGSTVTVQVPVPDAVATAVSQGEPVAVTGPDSGTEQTVIPPAVLDAAQDRPAPAGSDLAAATAVVASAGEAPVAAIVVAVAPAVAPTTSRLPHEVTVAVVDVDGTTDPRYTDAEVSRLVHEASSYWSDQTGGAVTFRAGASATRYTSSISCRSFTSLWNEARSRTGFQDGPNRHLVLMLPRAAHDRGYCGYGLGSVGASVSSGGVLSVADVSWPVLAHELGHNMSLLHANRLACTVASADAEQSPSGAFADTSCQEAEYGDLADVMSSSGLNAAGDLGAVGLRRLGALDAGDQQTVAGGGVTSVVLAPLGAGSGLRVATVTDPRNGNVYHLENRQAVGRDVYGFGGSGTYDARTNPRGATVGLRVLKRGASGSSVLLDPTPSACGAYCPWDADVVVAPGTTFRSAADGVEVRARQLADGRVAADVSVAGAGESHWRDPQAPAPRDPTPQAPSGEATVVTAAAVRARSTAATTLPVTVVTAAGGTRVPAGTVTVSAGDVRLASAPVLRGRASVRLPALPRGRQELVVTYEPPTSGGGAALAWSSAPVVLDVAGAPARVSASLVRRSVTVADAPSVTVSVTASGATPSGTVSVSEDGASLGSATLVRGRATVTLPPLSLGRHALVATYDGDDRALGARSSATVLSVVALPVSSVGASVSRAAGAQPATVTAAVRVAGRAGSGEISVVRDGQSIASGRLVGGRVALALPALPAGRHVLTVVHAGSATVTGGSRAVTVVVGPA